MKKFIILIFSMLFLLSCNLTSNPCSSIKENSLKETLKIDFDSIVEKNEIKGTNLCQIVIKRGGGLNVFLCIS